MNIPTYTFGVGDRFGHEAKAQLQAFLIAREHGQNICPVWNKSNREHTLIGSEPSQVRSAADDAVRTLGWKEPYFVDADHINLKTVDRFIGASDFFTLDVADFVGQPASDADAAVFLSEMKPWLGKFQLPGFARPYEVTEKVIQTNIGKFFRAIQEAGRIYRHVEAAKGKGNFITEISVDETDLPQTPLDLFFILAMIAREKIPVQTIAPKFTGRFNKGIDYVGDLSKFAQEFEENLLVLAVATKEFGLPAGLKLSVHSGSDKFSLYPIIRKLLRKHHAPLHVKTAGTNWLEEVIGLAEAGGDGLVLAKKIYREALAHFDELTAPYATVIDISPERLPTVREVEAWNSEQFASALRHDQRCPAYNPHFRQLMHVAFKIAAKFGAEYTQALEEHREIIARNVTSNLWDKHIKPLFCEV